MAITSRNVSCNQNESKHHPWLLMKCLDWYFSLMSGFNLNESTFYLCIYDCLHCQEFRSGGASEGSGLRDGRREGKIWGRERGIQDRKKIRWWEEEWWGSWERKPLLTLGKVSGTRIWVCFWACKPCVCLRRKSVCALICVLHVSARVLQPSLWFKHSLGSHYGLITVSVWLMARGRALIVLSLNHTT